MVVVDLETVYRQDGTAKLQKVDEYLQRIRVMVPEGAEVVLTGRAPVWLYLLVAHELHGRVRRLYYRSPVTGDVLIFDHSPY
ncbi:MAG: hypothetical protein DRP63_01475 [Planctomycetota bacterium]|nr:MAG: hypothetical protein DRP63_01475 [Planctomycetota bacterium]